jgi:diguanylate cyclase (GGDEF)-like protein/PAS domain S-box-containing protein
MSSGDLPRFLAQSPVPAFMVERRDSAFVFVLANAALAAAAGVEASAILGRTPQDLLPPAMAELLARHLQAAWDRRRAVEFAACLAHADGPRDWDIGILPVETAAGDVIAIAGFGVDPWEMTRRRLAQQTGGGLVLQAIQAQEAMVCRTLPDTTLTFVNAAYARTAERDPRELLGQRFIDHLPETEGSRVLAHLAGLTPASPMRGYTLGFTSRAGTPGWQRWIDIGAFDDQGRLVELHSVGRDITEIQKALLRASESETRFRAVVETISEGVLLTDLQGRLVYANLKVAEILGRPSAELVGRHLASLATPVAEAPHPPGPAPGRDESSESESLRAFHNGEAVARHRDGRLLRVHISMSEVELDGVRHFIGVIRDNTAIHEAQRRIERLAYHDELTDLPNQRRLKEDLRAAMAEPGARLALLLVDLMDFSVLNGAIGFAAGDRVLRSTARRLGAALPPDALLARFGGDRFAVVLRDPADAEAEAARLAAAIEGAVPEGESEDGFRLPPVSIGIALAPLHDTAPEGLLEAAEMALLDARRHAPGGCRSFAPSLRSHASRRFSLAQGLRRALERGGLFIEVQPRFSATERRLTGGEALVRWRQEDGTLVGPADFVPLAEETGLIRPLTDHVLGQVMPLLRYLQGEQRISMNIPPTQMARHGLAALIGRHLAQQGVPGSRLSLELTESALLEGTDMLDENLRHLQQLGCGIAIDDFGTGYSSLSRLRNLPIDELKIDRSFIRDAARDTAGVAFLHAIGAMANALGLRLVAEGVETEAELAQARAIGCHEVQGWLWGKPMPPAEFLALIGA